MGAVMGGTLERTGRLLNKNTIVTGGSRGIGAAIAKAFVAEGAAVAIIHHEDNANAQLTLGILRDRNARCLAAECDVADPSQVRPCVEDIVAKLGGIDILVNCAGIGGDAPFEESSLEVWNRVLSVNLTGAYLMCRYCYPPMKKQRSGRIINISSQLAFCGYAQATPYCASKAGMIGLTRSLALEGAPFGVLVNSIAPGATMTDNLSRNSDEWKATFVRRIPLGRYGRPEEIAATAVFLASDDAAFYVGQTLSPNGGDVFR
jgi:3-oxoacyl-[acyl-carrier protein] reductase